MPVHEYKCAADHITTRIVSIKDKDEPKESVPCEARVQKATLLGSVHKCRCTAYLLASKTGTPILKRGIGGFFKPNA